MVGRRVGLDVSGHGRECCSSATTPWEIALDYCQLAYDTSSFLYLTPVINSLFRLISNGVSRRTKSLVGREQSLEELPLVIGSWLTM